jgi:hypothetical protein
MAVEKTAPLMSIMAMASYGRHVIHFFRVVCVGKELEAEFSDCSDLSKIMVMREVLAKDNPTYENLLEWSVRPPYKGRTSIPAFRVISIACSLVRALAKQLFLIF